MCAAEISLAKKGDGKNSAPVKTRLKKARKEGVHPGGKNGGVRGERGIWRETPEAPLGGGVPREKKKISIRRKRSKELWTGSVQN